MSHSVRPNLLFIFADQWRRSAMGCQGEDPVYTPNMDAFAAGGLRFTNAVSTFPLCSPHRASLLTGKHPLFTGVFTNCKPCCEAHLRDEEICISDVLSEAGYDTAYIGKWHLAIPETRYEKEPISGARNWDAYTPPGKGRHGFKFWHSYGAWDAHLDPHYWEDTPEQIKPHKWSPEHETDVLLDWLEKRESDTPFCAFVSWNPPHSPYDQVPQKYLDLYPEDIPFRENVRLGDIHCHTYEKKPYDEAGLRLATRQYYAAVSGLDDNFGRILRGLDEMKLRENTIVVLTADHGDMLGSHELITKHVWYEESIGIPLIMAGPGIPAGKITDTVIGSPDMMPTLLSMMGLNIPETVEGDDLSAAVQSGETDHEKLCYLCACPGRDVFQDAFREAGEDILAFGWRAVRSENYTYVADVGYEVTPHLTRLLYDLKADPLQLSPKIITDPVEDPIAADMEEKLRLWLEKQNDGFIRHLK